MRAVIAAALAASAIPSVWAHAQTAAHAPVNDPQLIAEGFFQGLKRGNVEGALDGLVVSTPHLFKSQPEMRGKFATQIGAALSTYGPVLRWERIDSKPLGTLMRRDLYLVQHRDIVVRWHFTYMQVERGWIIGYFGFEDQPLTWFN